MSLLEKILADLGKGLQIFLGVEPIIQQFTPAGTVQTEVSKVTDDLTLLAASVSSTQAAVGAMTTPAATEAQKVQAITQAALRVLTTAEITAGKKVVNEALYNQAAGELAQGMTDLLNSIGS